MKMNILTFVAVSAMLATSLMANDEPKKEKKTEGLFEVPFEPLRDPKSTVPVGPKWEAGPDFNSAASQAKARKVSKQLANLSTAWRPTKKLLEILEVEKIEGRYVIAIQNALLIAEPQIRVMKRDLDFVAMDARMSCTDISVEKWKELFKYKVDQLIEETPESELKK